MRLFYCRRPGTFDKGGLDNLKGNIELQNGTSEEVPYIEASPNHLGGARLFRMSPGQVIELSSFDVTTRGIVGQVAPRTGLSSAVEQVIFTLEDFRKISVIGYDWRGQTILQEKLPHES